MSEAPSKPCYECGQAVPASSTGFLCPRCARTAADRSIAPAPVCWKCTYPLSGLPVDGNCPECGTVIWWTPNRDMRLLRTHAREAIGYAIASAILFPLCLGPLAGLLAVPAILKARHVKSHLGVGPWPEGFNSAAAGGVIGWIVAVLSVISVFVGIIAVIL